MATMGVLWEGVPQEFNPGRIFVTLITAPSGCPSAKAKSST